MQKKSNLSQQAYIVLAVLAAIFSMLMFARLLPYCNLNKTDAPPIGFVGTYQTPAMDNPEVLSTDDIPNTYFNKEIVLRGHFDRALRKGEQLFFLNEYLEVQIQLDGAPFFTSGTAADYPSISRSGGMAWAFCKIPRDVSTQDIFTITLRSQYQNNYYSAYGDFLDSLSTGDSGALARRVLSEGWFFILLSASFMVISLLVLLFSMLLRLYGIRIHPSVDCFALFALADGLRRFLEPKYSTLLFDNALMIMQIATTCMLLATIMAFAYLSTLLKTKVKRLNTFFLYLSTALAAAVLLFQLFGFTDAYAIRTFLMFVFGVMSFVCAGEVFYEVRHNPRHEFHLLIIPGLFFVLSAILEFINYALEIVPTDLIFFIGQVVLMSAQFLLAVRAIKKALLLSQRATELEHQLTESRTSNMLSQIQPHFLYNALTSIKSLCGSDPQRAEDAMAHFSYFLRGNLDSLANVQLIPFNKEIEHVVNYFYLEKMRFEDRVNLTMELNFKDFLLPPLTLQPLVENAVQYGITKKKNGGTVTIHTERNDNNIIITITDDGVGFDTTAVPEDGRSHTGIENVKSRLELQCGGSLEIKSEKGKGTNIHITLPGNETVRCQHQ